MKIFYRQDEQCQTGEEIQGSLAALKDGQQGSLIPLILEGKSYRHPLQYMVLE